MLLSGKPVPGQGGAGAPAATVKPQLKEAAIGLPAASRTVGSVAPPRTVAV